MATALDLIVMTHRLPGGQRRVGGLARVGISEEGRVVLGECVRYDDVADTWLLVEEPPFVAEGLRTQALSAEEVGAWRAC